MSDSQERLSIIRGIPLAEEKGTGALTLSGYIRELTERYGPREAANLRLGDTTERWTYDDLWARSVEVAKSLLAMGLTRGTRVGIMMTNRLEFLSATFGTALAGGVATTFSTFSTQPELEVILEKSCCSYILFERHVLKKDFAAMLVEAEPGLAAAKPGELLSGNYPFLRYAAAVDSDDLPAGMETWQQFLARGADISDALVDATAATVTPADPGVLFFSSGSTGKPKGILSAHRGVTLQLWRWAQWLGFGEEGVRSWSANGFFWSGNFAMGIGGALSVGGTLILQRTFDPEDAVDLMHAEGATYLFAWPHQWKQLMDAPNWLTTDLSSLKYVDRDSPIAQHPDIEPGDYTEPAAAYGNTETFTLSTVFPANTPKEAVGGSHGKPAAGNIIKIVDPMSGETVPMGESGEIAVKGATLMLGYVGIPLDESVDEQGFFRTGDGGYVDAEGRLFWQGRLNDIIKTGGANVSPIEVDTVLATYPGIKIPRCVGVPDELLGELVVACIVPQAGAELDADAIRAFLKERLASFKIPRKILFFTDEELETTGSSKIKLETLRKLASDRLAAEG